MQDGWYVKHLFHCNPVMVIYELTIHMYLIYIPTYLIAIKCLS